MLLSILVCPKKNNSPSSDGPKQCKEPKTYLVNVTLLSSKLKDGAMMNKRIKGK